MHIILYSINNEFITNRITYCMLPLFNTSFLDFSSLRGKFGPRVLLKTSSEKSELQFFFSNHVIIPQEVKLKWPNQTSLL